RPADVTAGNNGGHHGQVLQIGNAGPRAGQLVLLFMLTECCVDVPPRSKDAGVERVQIVSACLLDTIEGARRSGDCELRAIAARWIAEDRGVDQLARCDGEAELSSVEVSRDVGRNPSADRKAEAGDVERRVDANALVRLLHAVIRAE